MPMSVCPAAIVAAPLEEVWALLVQPETYDLWWDAHTERIVPEGPATPGQVVYAWASGLGKRWEVQAKIEEIDTRKHQIAFTTTLPLGVQAHNRLNCAALDERSCRLQFG